MELLNLDFRRFKSNNNLDIIYLKIKMIVAPDGKECSQLKLLKNANFLCKKPRNKYFGLFLLENFSLLL
jgi:hypothetical protein